MCLERLGGVLRWDHGGEAPVTPIVGKGEHGRGIVVEVFEADVKEHRVLFQRTCEIGAKSKLVELRRLAEAVQSNQALPSDG